MMLEKDGVTQEAVHPSDIARLKQAGYKEVKEVAPVVEATPVVEEVKPESKPNQQTKDQTTVEEVLQPEKKGKGKNVSKS